MDIKNFKNIKKIKKDKYFLLVSRLVPYKKVDLAINAFNKSKDKLLIIGTGSELKNLKKISNKNIDFLGKVSEAQLKNYYQRAQGLIFPQLEDFGLVAIEAMAAGTPVIAFKKGGSRDFMVKNINGVTFERQNMKSLLQSLYKFKNMDFDPKKVSKTVQKFDKSNFNRQILKLIKGKI